MKPQLLKNEPILSETKKQQLNAVYRYMGSKDVVKKIEKKKKYNLNEKTGRDYI